MPETGQKAVVGVPEVVRAGLADQHQGVARADEAAVGAVFRIGPEAILAVQPLEADHRRVAQGQGVAGWQIGDEADADEVFPAEGAGIVEGQIGHHRHAVVLDQPEAQLAGLLFLVEHQRPEQPGPQGADAGRPVAAHELQIAFPLFRVGACEHPALPVQQLGSMDVVHALSLLVPTRRVGPPEAVKQFQCGGQGQIVGCDLHVEQGHIHVEKQIEIHMGDTQADRRVARPQGDAQGRDIGAPIDGHRRRPAGLPVRRARTAFSIQKALHVGQEGHELFVVALLELRRVGGELVVDERPASAVGHQAVDAGHIFAREAGPDLHRPDQDIPEMADKVLWLRKHGSPFLSVLMGCRRAWRGALPLSSIDGKTRQAALSVGSAHSGLPDSVRVVSARFAGASRSGRRSPPHASRIDTRQPDVPASAPSRLPPARPIGRGPVPSIGASHRKAVRLARHGALPPFRQRRQRRDHPACRVR